MTIWWGLLAPAGVAKEIIARLHADAVRVLNTTDMKERLAAQGAVVVTNTPEQFAAYIKSEIANWGAHRRGVRRADGLRSKWTMDN